MSLKKAIKWLKLVAATTVYYTALYAFCYAVGAVSVSIFSLLVGSTVGMVLGAVVAFCVSVAVAKKTLAYFSKGIDRLIRGVSEAETSEAV